MSSIVFQTAWCSGSRVVPVAESSTMSAQHKQTPGDHNVLGLRVEHQKVNHHQSVGYDSISGSPLMFKGMPLIN